jgi:hypothetical protein
MFVEPDLRSADLLLQVDRIAIARFSFSFGLYNANFVTWPS